jgi:hypothetical protein
MVPEGRLAVVTENLYAAALVVFAGIVTVAAGIVTIRLYRGGDDG